MPGNHSKHDIKTVIQEIEESHKTWVQNVRNNITKDVGPISSDHANKVNAQLCELSLFAMTRFNVENPSAKPISVDELPQCKKHLCKLY